MNQKLIIALLYGDQCHCQKVGYRKVRKSEVANLCSTNGVKGARVIIWRALNSYCHGNLMR